MIGSWAVSLLQKLAAILSVALIWLGAFRLNELMFTALAYSQVANWIFLPAAIRILSVLLLGYTGAIGLMLGAYLTLAPELSAEHSLFLAISSGLAPLAALWLCRRLFTIAPDLAGLRPWHVVILSLANAAANSIILNSYLASVGQLRGHIVQVMTIFVGDVLGTALVLLLLSTLLAAFVPPRRD